MEVLGLPIIPGYRLVRPIGAGGMGAVYEAERVSTHETFAVKVIRKELLSDRTLLARFEREVGALRAIRHPNVVNVFEWSLGGAGPTTQPFVVMELLEGESLEQCLRREGALPPLRAVRIALQVVEGLAAAHAEGVVHRDLGPSNLFLQHHASGKITVKLLDFGLARQKVGGDPTSGMTQEGTLLGKPAYVAPELFRSRSLDERADVFACGVVLFRMLSGRLPYKATGGQPLWVERWVERETRTEYPPVTVFAPRTAPPLARVVARALRKHPEDRYRSAREMQVDLLDAERGLVAQELSSPGSGLSADGSVPTAPLSTDVDTATVGGRTTVTLPATTPRRRRRAPAVTAIVGLGLAAAVAWRVAADPDDPAVPPTAAGTSDPATTAAAGQAPAPPAAPLATSTPSDVGPTSNSAPEASAPSVDLQPVASATAPPAVVHLDFAGLPPGAQVTVDGRAVDPGVGMDVTSSTASLPVVVTVPGGRFERWKGTIVADHSQVIRPRLAARTRTEEPATPATATETRTAPSDVGREPPDAGSGVLQGRMGTEFLTDWRGEP